VVRKPSASQPTKPPLELVVSSDDAKSLLQERIEKGTELRRRQVANSRDLEALKHEYSKWDSFNSELLKRLFTAEELAHEYDHWGIAAVSTYDPSLGQMITDLYADIDMKIHRIDSIIERLELIPLSASHQSQRTSREGPHPESRSKRVFVVHGHDEAAKTSLEVFLHEIGLEPIVLHRQADEGLTIIEKFEKHSDVGYAFVLLTPDEVSYLSAEENRPDADRNKEFRARPNVLFEFGYFVGKLGRSRVCCLYFGNVSLPSDVSGMIYKKYEKSIDEVAYGIIKDLRAAGYAIA
jgi:predicted nucleotide-binding protein